jgi:hypothetical protein
MVRNDGGRDLRCEGRIGAEPSAIAQRARAEGAIRCSSDSSDSPTYPCDPWVRSAAFLISSRCARGRFGEIGAANREPGADFDERR